MKVCESIEKLEGGFLIKGLRFPHGPISGEPVVRATWDNVIDTLTQAANEQSEVVHITRAEYEAVKRARGA